MSIVIGEVPRGFENPADALLIPLPPQNGGAFGWGQGYLSFGTDFGDVKLRVAIWNDGGADGGWWRVNELVVKSNQGRVHATLQDGDSKVSVVRLKQNAADTGQQPVGYLYEIILKS